MFTEKECRPIADIGFVIDSSGSIGRSNWGRMKRFLKALVSKLDVSPSSTHISAVAYSNNPEVVYRFNNRQATDDVNNAFDSMRWQRGFTYTDKALLLADSDLYNFANGMRPNVAKVRTFLQPRLVVFLGYMFYFLFCIDDLFSIPYVDIWAWDSDRLLFTAPLHISFY